MEYPAKVLQKHLKIYWMFLQGSIFNSSVRSYAQYETTKSKSVAGATGTTSNIVGRSWSSESPRITSMFELRTSISFKLGRTRYPVYLLNPNPQSIATFTDHIQESIRYTVAAANSNITTDALRRRRWTFIWCANIETVTKLDVSGVIFWNHLGVELGWCHPLFWTNGHHVLRERKKIYFWCISWILFH